MHSLICSVVNFENLFPPCILSCILYSYLLEFVKENDDLAQNIANEGFQFIKNNLRMKDVKCYWKELLMKYSQLLKYPVEDRSDMIVIS